MTQEIRYTHRNGETEPPAIHGAFWAQEPIGRMRMMFVGDNNILNRNEIIIEDWYANHVGDEWDFRQSDLAGWRWWGPVEVPNAQDMNP